MKEFIVPIADNLKNFTDNTYPQGSFYFDMLLKKRDIRVNGVKVDKNVNLSVGDKVCYYTTASQECREAFCLVYEDDNILVIDKDSGVNAEAVFFTLAQEKECYFIHRLDRNTQGIMIFAKTKRAEKELLTAFKERQVEKVYHALCVGELPKQTDILTAYLEKDAKKATVNVTLNPQRGAKIITEYKVIAQKQGLSEVEITLHTGKTHQIRAHMAFIGCPVLGDMKYGDKTVNQRYNCTRQRLISKRLTLHIGGLLAYLNNQSFISKYNLSVGE